MNFKNVSIILTICALVGGWMVTASRAEDNKHEIEKARKERQELRGWVMEQRTMNTQQYAINQKLVEILDKK